VTKRICFVIPLPAPSTTPPSISRHPFDVFSLSSLFTVVLFKGRVFFPQTVLILPPCALCIFSLLIAYSACLPATSGGAPVVRSKQNFPATLFPSLWSPPLPNKERAGGRGDSPERSLFQSDFVRLINDPPYGSRPSQTSLLFFDSTNLFPPD